MRQMSMLLYSPTNGQDNLKRNLRNEDFPSKPHLSTCVDLYTTFHDISILATSQRAHQAGIVVTHAPTLASTPKRNSQQPQAMPDQRDAQRVRASTPLFCNDRPITIRNLYIDLRNSCPIQQCSLHVFMKVTTDMNLPFFLRGAAQHNKTNHDFCKESVCPTLPGLADSPMRI